LAIKYAVERVELSPAQFAAWHGWIAGTDLELRGRCPICAHDSPMTVKHEFTALEATARPRELAISMSCGCGEPHSGRPASADTGCGRHWNCTATTDAQGRVTLSPLADPALVTAADALRVASATQLASLRGAAEKWIAGVTALFGLFGLAGVAFTRSTVTGLGTWWQVGIGIAAAVSAALAGLAVFLSYRAAYGWPVTRSIPDNDALRDWYAAQQAAPRVQARFFRHGVRAAAGALGSLVVTVGLLWFAPQTTSAGPLVRVTLTDGWQVCGTLQAAAASGTPEVRRANDGTVISIPVRSLASLSTATACLEAGQPAADGSDRDRSVPGGPPCGVVVRVTGVVQGDEFQAGVQAGRTR
jgi:hypothetical protein